MELEICIKKEVQSIKAFFNFKKHFKGTKKLKIFVFIRSCGHPNLPNPEVADTSTPPTHQPRNAVLRHKHSHPTEPK